MSGYVPLIPELLLLFGVAWAMFADRLPGSDRGSAWVGAALALAAAVAAALVPGNLVMFGGLLVADGIARFAGVGIAALSAIWLLWLSGRGEWRIREAVALSLLATMGAMWMAQAAELVTLVVAVELATLPAYVLIGYHKRRVTGLEGALKYFLLSMMTSLVMLYGMSFVYGVTGTTRYAGFDAAGASSLGVLAILLTLVGMFAKLSAAPFHYWAPDAYEGAEPWAVAFVSTIPKIAGVAALVRLTVAFAGTAPIVGQVLLVVAVASIVLGNLAALTQTDVRRMMAYSGVAHAGYLMLGVSALSQQGYGAAVFYAVAYSIPSLGIMLIAAEEGPLLADFGGLARRRPAVAWQAVIMLLSLIGVPPLVGFFGKLYLFGAAIRAGYAPWVVVAIIMSVVSAGYYLRIVRAAFFGDDTDSVRADSPSAAASIAILACSAGIVAAGLGAGILLAWLGAAL